MNSNIGGKIKRPVRLRYAGDKATVIVEQPRGRRWVKRTYTPTPSSIKRIKRLIGYPLCCAGYEYSYVDFGDHWKIFLPITNEYFAYV